MSDTQESISEVMERIAEDGWCIVLKKLPPGFPWLFDDEPKSEYDGGSGKIHEFGHGLWCCEVTDVRREGKWRPNNFVTAATADEAIAKMSQRLDERKTLAGNEDGRLDDYPYV